MSRPPHTAAEIIGTAHPARCEPVRLHRNANTQEKKKRAKTGKTMQPSQKNLHFCPRSHTQRSDRARMAGWAGEMGADLAERRSMRPPPSPARSARQLLQNVSWPHPQNAPTNHASGHHKTSRTTHPSQHPRENGRFQPTTTPLVAPGHDLHRPRHPLDHSPPMPCRTQWTAWAWEGDGRLNSAQLLRKPRLSAPGRTRAGQRRGAEVLPARTLEPGADRGEHSFPPN